MKKILLLILETLLIPFIWPLFLLKGRWAAYKSSCHDVMSDWRDIIRGLTRPKKKLKCGACGRTQGKGDWEKAMDAQAKASGSRGFFNLSGRYGVKSLFLTMDIEIHQEDLLADWNLAVNGKKHFPIKGLDQ